MRVRRLFAAGSAGLGAGDGPPPLVSGLDAASFDKTVRPQDDLFRFVNGGWLTRTEIPADKPAYGGFFEAFDRSQEQLKVLVEAAAAGQTRGRDPTARRSATSIRRSWTRRAPTQLGLSAVGAELKAIEALSTKADLARTSRDRPSSASAARRSASASTATRRSRRATRSTSARAASACRIATTT